jgi:hypothetical protein
MSGRCGMKLHNFLSKTGSFLLVSDCTVKSFHYISNVGSSY